MAPLSSTPLETSIRSDLGDARSSASKYMTADQSFELVHVLVCGVVAEVVANLRLFPQECTVVKLYNIEDPECSSYKRFIQSRQDPSTLGDRKIKHPKCPVFRVLEPGVDYRSDKILMWLDGLGDAIHNKFLESLHFRIFDSKIDESHQLEEYCMDIEYSDGGADIAFNFKTSSVNTKGLKSSQAVQSDLGQLIYYLIQLLVQKGPSNANILLDMKLKYNDSCPEGYHPSGFSLPTTCFSAGRQFLMKERRLGSLDTGHHAVAVKHFLPLPVITSKLHLPDVYSPKRGKQTRHNQRPEILTGNPQLQLAQCNNIAVVDKSQEDYSLHMTDQALRGAEHEVKMNFTSSALNPETQESRKFTPTVLSDEETQTPDTARTVIRGLKYLCSGHKNLGSRNSNLPDTSSFTVFLDSSSMSPDGEQVDKVEQGCSLDTRPVASTTSAETLTHNRETPLTRSSARISTAVGKPRIEFQKKRKANSGATPSRQCRKLSSAAVGSQTSPLEVTRRSSLAALHNSPTVIVNLRR